MENTNTEQNISVKKTNWVACAGFAVALAGLLVFWVPGIGLGLCALGAVLSLIGLFKRPYACAFFGVLTSVVSLAFMAFFVGGDALREKVASWFREEHFAEYVIPVFSRKHDAGLPDPSEATPRTSATAKTSVEKVAPSTPFGDRLVKGDDEEIASEELEDDGFESDVVECDVDPLPVSAFAEIARYKYSWPKTVRLLQPREIILFDKARREIMGKMEIPAGTVVEVLAVLPDGVLEVLDRTEQSFRVLAAYTNFAEEYQKRNELDE